MHTIELWCSDGWMKLAVTTRNSEMRDAPGDPIVTKPMLFFAQFCEMIRMHHCTPSQIRCWSPWKRFTLICRALERHWYLYLGFPTRWKVSWKKFVSIFVYNYSRSSVHTPTIINGISSLGWELVLSRLCSGPSMDRTEWEHTWNGEQKHCLHENHADGSMESSRPPCRDHVSSGWIVQCIIIHRSKHGPFGSKFLSIWLESKAKNWWFMWTMRRLTIQEWRKTFSSITHWRGSVIHLTDQIYRSRTFLFLGK
jgi:hypothetical protein